MIGLHLVGPQYSWGGVGQFEIGVYVCVYTCELYVHRYVNQCCSLVPSLRDKRPFLLCPLPPG